MASIFFSYAHDDADHAVRLLQHLRPAATRHNLEIFKDDLSLLPGDRWEAELERALNEAKLLIAVVSPSAMASAWCAKEWARAHERGIPILPILLMFTHVPGDHLLATYQFANHGAPVVVVGSFLDRVAAELTARVYAKLAKVMPPTPEAPRPSDQPAPPAWRSLPLLADERPTGLGEVRLERWLFLEPVGEDVRITWKDEHLELLWEGTATLASLPALVRRELGLGLANNPGAVAETMLESAGAAALSWVLPERAQAAAPLDKAVRLRVVNRVEALRGFPWRLLRRGKRWLVTDGLWTVEESASATPQDVALLPSDRVLVVAPGPEDDASRGVLWTIEKIRGFVQTTLVGRGPDDGPSESPDVFLFWARTVQDLDRAGPRALVLVLAPVNVEEDGELSVRMEVDRVGRRSVRLAEIAKKVGSDRRLLYLDALDPRDGQRGRPLPVSPALADAWPCVVTRGMPAASIDHAQVLLGFLENLLAGGREPVLAASHPPHRPTEAPEESQRSRAALAMLRVYTRYGRWRADNEALRRVSNVVEIHIDRTGQRSEAYSLAQELMRDRGWRAAHAIVVGSNSMHRLDLVGRQIVDHVRQGFRGDAGERVKVEPLTLDGLPGDSWLMEQRLADALPSTDGTLRGGLDHLAERAPDGRTLLLVDWGVVGPGAEDGAKSLSSAVLRGWLELSHRRIAPICDELGGRVVVMHLLAVEGDEKIRERIEGGLPTIVPFADRHPGVLARLLSPFGAVRSGDVELWLRTHAPWAPQPHAAIAASIIKRTKGSFPDVVVVLNEGKRFGFRYDWEAGLKLLDDLSGEEW